MDNKELAELAKFITTNPTIKRDYYINPIVVLERMVPPRIPRIPKAEQPRHAPEGKNEQSRAELDDENEQPRAELRRLVEEKINTSTLKCDREYHFKRYSRARLIAHNPRLRTLYFENPSRVLAWAEPRRGLRQRISLAVPEDVRKDRDKLGEEVEAVISNDPRLISDREAAVEMNVFLSEALRNPRRTFDAIIRLSVVAFAVGVGFLIAGVVAAVLIDDTAQKAVVGGASGGGGAVTVLSTLFAITRESIRRANRENAHIRLAFTGFATEMANLRAISIKESKDAQERRKEIRAATKAAADSLAALAREEQVLSQRPTVGAARGTAAAEVHEGGAEPKSESGG